MQGVAPGVELRRLAPEDITLLGRIDRSEEVSVGYSVEHGHLVSTDVDWQVPPWDPVGIGDHSVARLIEHLHLVIERGAILIGAFDGTAVAGLMVVDLEFDETLAWLAFLHVTRSHRRRGVATALWDEAVRSSRDAGRRRMYVSATPSGSAVGFYLSRGCTLATPPHPGLFAEEPDDIHLICGVGS